MEPPQQPQPSSAGKRTPRVGIVMPAWQAESFLPRSLPAALRAAAGRPVLVVDAGSDDRTGAVARELGARVLRLPERAGPAEARNAGVQALGVDVVLFVDADCVAHPDVVERVERAFASDPELVAITGAYDDAPPDPGFFSQYMNLRHHLTHRSARREAATFWAGCGAVRRSVFLRVGGFDALRYPEPTIEDIELGLRLRRQGRTRLDPDLHVTHLKRWTLRSVVETDVRRRAVPWSRLILETGELPDDLNLRWRERLAAGLAPAALLGLAAAPLALATGHLLLGLVAALPPLASLGLQRELVGGFRRLRGPAFAARAWAFHQVHLIYSAATLVVCSLHHVRTRPRGGGGSSPPAGSTPAELGGADGPPPVARPGSGRGDARPHGHEVARALPGGPARHALEAHQHAQEALLEGRAGPALEQAAERHGGHARRVDQGGALLDLEVQRLEGAPQIPRAQRGPHEVRHETAATPPHLGQRIARRHQRIAGVVEGEDEPPPRPQHAAQLRERAVQIGLAGEVVQRGERGDGVEAGVREGEPPHVGRHHADALRQTPTRAARDHAGDVHGDRMARERLERGAQAIRHGLVEDVRLEHAPGEGGRQPLLEEPGVHRVAVPTPQALGTLAFPALPHAAPVRLGRLHGGENRTRGCTRKTSRCGGSRCGATPSRWRGAVPASAPPPRRASRTRAVAALRMSGRLPAPAAAPGRGVCAAGRRAEPALERGREDGA
jgi:GT2 family glycosyltransferase